jgi:hypothetical protein
LPQGCKALFNALTGSIDSDMVCGPSFKVARHDLVPTYGHLDGACFNSMTVLNLVRTDDFNFHSLCSKTLRNAAPCAARDLERIDRICNHSVTKAKIVVSHGIGHPIPFFSDGESLFARDDRQIVSMRR